LSHYTKVETTFDDRDCLVDALKQIGMKGVETFDKPQPLNGFYSSDRQAAEVIIRRQHLGTLGDLGFRRTNRGKFELVVDDMDQRSHFDGKWLSNLKREYGRSVVLSFAEREGYEVVSSTTKSQVLRITMRRSV